MMKTDMDTNLHPITALTELAFFGTVQGLHVCDGYESLQFGMSR